ncbi:hypothetical protein [Bradyrhizobium sp. USDA 3458]|uniref:hypothetical protein n=1 Tax=Bradyrhizobium sp. USDA 3458 TaxID=2591461 RepID=UPI0011439A8D|nr:hypothetical protein [Bradyrhizobium sp. USDA 3458]MCP1915074.1 hypothetical protein [Bradyrhizobium elkanii]
MRLLILLATFAATISAATAETAVERQCASGKCTSTYIASTCKTWNRTHGGDLAICDSYRESCLPSGRWDDRNRHIDVVVKR